MPAAEHLWKVSDLGRANIARMDANQRLIVKLVSMHPMTQANCVDLFTELLDLYGSPEAAIAALERGEVGIEPSPATA